MNTITFLGSGLLLATLPVLASPPTVVSPAVSSGIEFVANKHQWEPSVLFAADVPGGRLFMEHGRLVQSLYDARQLEELHHHSASPAPNQRIRAHAYSTTFVGANSHAIVRGGATLAGRNNYFLGNDPKRWASDVPGYGEVRYEQLYPGTDLHFYSKRGVLEYDFELAAGANANRIALRYAGQDKLRVKDGALHIATTVGTVVEQRPYAYQMVGGQQQRIACEYSLSAGNTVGFALPQGYNHALPLVIDPVLVYSSYTGSPASNYGYTASYDSLGNMYSAGTVFSAGFPTTVGAYSVSFAGSQDMGIIKYNTRATTGASSRLYATYIGGSQDDHPHSMVVDPSGNLIVLGSSPSNNFPTTATAYDRTLNGGADIVLCKLNPTGSTLLGSTYLGGSGADGQVTGALNFNYGDTYRGDVTTDKRGNIYVASITQSNNFPTLNGFQLTSGGGASDAVVVKMNPGLTTMVWGNYLGGAGVDAGYSVALDSISNVFVSGGTTSRDFPGRQSGYHASYQGGTADGFVARISANGDDLVQSTYIGTNSYDQTYFVQLNKKGQVYTYGQTDGAFPTSPGVYSNPNSRQYIQKLNPRLTTSLLSTVIGNGSAGQISPTAFLVDNCGQIIICGWGGNSIGFPVTSNAIQTTGGTGSFGYFYIAQLSGDASNLVYGTFFGSGSSHVDGGTSRFDKRGIIYQAMCTGSGILPTTANAWSSTNGSSWNNAAFKIDVLQLDANFTPSYVPSGPPVHNGCAPVRIYFDRPAVAGTGTRWDFGNGQISTASNSVSTIYQNPGRYIVRLTVYDSTSCVQSVTATDTVTIYGLPRAAAGPDKSICAGGSTTLSVADAGPGVIYSWFPPTGLSATTGRTVQATPTATTIYIVRARTPNGCTGADTVQISVAAAPRLAASGSVPNAFTGEAIAFNSTVQAPVSAYRWDFGDGGSSVDANPTHTYTRPGDFQVRVTATYGPSCQEVATVPVIIRNFELPNIITPNNDGVNESFQPFTSFKPVHVQIFNRWGRLVFEQDNYVKGWGDVNTAAGVYFYRLVDSNGQSWKGNVEVVH